MSGCVIHERSNDFALPEINAKMISYGATKSDHYTLVACLQGSTLLAVIPLTYFKSASPL